MQQEYCSMVGHMTSSQDTHHMLLTIVEGSIEAALLIWQIVCLQHSGQLCCTAEDALCLGKPSKLQVIVQEII